jgi:hypothetical protein
MYRQLAGITLPPRETTADDGPSATAPEGDE